MRSKTHLMIPDCQVKPGVPLNHLRALGHYIVHRQPDVIIQIGDFADMHSLSSYDKGKKAGEGARYEEDIEAARRGMEKLLGPINEYNARAAMNHKQRYKPRMILTLGNHEERIRRYVEDNANLEGKLSYSDLPYEEWEVYDFLAPVEVDGVTYSHYFVRNDQGRVLQTKRGMPSARTMIRREMKSCTAGHLQGLDYAVHPTSDRIIQGLIAGSFYQHEEDYLSLQGTHYWRGVVLKHEVDGNGQYDPLFVSLNYLLRKFG